MERSNGIIFDMDGTLWDSSAEVAESWTEVIKREYNPERVITCEDMQAVMGKPMDLLSAELFPELSKEERNNLMGKCCIEENKYLREHGAKLYPDVCETIKKLYNKYRLFIVSNCQSGYIEAFLEHYQFEKYFDDIECYGNNSLGKGYNIREIVRRNNLERAVYVGDIQGDYDASMEAGVMFIHAAYGFGSIKEEVLHISGIRELPDAADKIF